MIKKMTDKLFCGINMTWLKVLIFAAATAILTSVFLIVPIFKNTSFEQMGVTFEAWILFAVIIMSNCKKPIESALKTFVFFLVSQPLIYLLQVPFSDMGWGLFGYYRYWFILTVLTFPAAFAGWFLTKKNWISTVILLPVVLYLSYTSAYSFRFAFAHFPYRIVTAVFCLLQILLYMVAFTKNKWQKIIGIIIPSIIMCVVLFATAGNLQTNGTMFLPDSPTLTDSAVVVTEGEGIADISIASTGEDSMVRVQGKAYGTMDFTIEDGDNVYSYSLRIYEDDEGHSQVEINEA